MIRFKHILLALSLVGLGFLTVNLNAEKKTPPNPQQVPLIPRQLLFGNPEKTSARLSHDGNRLAYLAPNEKNVLNVWVKDLTKEGKARQVTSDNKRGIRQFAWQYDDSSILYIQDKDGDENGHLFQTNLETLETKDLTPYDGVKVAIIAAEPEFPQEILIQMNKRDPKLFDVFRLNLQTGNITLDTENPGGVIQWIADHNLQIKATQSYTENGSALVRVRDSAEGAWRDWLTFDPNEIGDVLDFTADNKSLYVITSLDGDTSRLLKIDVATGEKTVIAEDPNYDLSGIMLNPTTHVLEAVGVERERNDWIVIDPAIKPDFEFLEKHFQGPFALTSRDLANQNWLVVSHSDIRPGHYYVYHRPSKNLEFLFSTQPALEKYQLSPMEPIAFKTRDGLTLHGYLTLPAGLEPRNLPTVLLVHGGPWSRDSWGLNPQAQWLANRGYAVLQINFRGSTGYGKAFLNAGNREWADKMHNDLLDGKKWLIDQGIANPEKVAIYGGSYGGYAALVGLAFTPGEFCCGVDVVGPSNLITLLQTLPPYWSPLKSKMELRVGKLETEEEFLKSRSPLFKANQIRQPLLIAQGANDPRVKQAESDQIVAAMRANKLPVEYLLFSDEGHGFARPDNRIKFYAAAEDFLAKYLGGREEPPAAEENWEGLKR